MYRRPLPHVEQVDRGLTEINTFLHDDRILNEVVDVTPDAFASMLLGGWTPARVAWCPRCEIMLAEELSSPPDDLATKIED
jgi:hypothetical protein